MEVATTEKPQETQRGSAEASRWVLPAMEVVTTEEQAEKPPGWSATAEEPAEAGSWALDHNCLVHVGAAMVLVLFLEAGEPGGPASPEGRKVASVACTRPRRRPWVLHQPT